MTLRIGACDCRILGTVAGWMADGARVHEAADAFRPEAIALGIPPEDLDPLGALVADPLLAEDLPDLDGHDGHFIDLLRQWGDIQVAPSPDLASAHATGLPLHAIDLDDEAHTDLYTRRVKVHHLVQRASAHKRLLKAKFPDDAHGFALEWDRILCRVRPLALLEQDREAHMAECIRDLAHDHARLLVVLPAARFAGVVEKLR